MSKPEKNDFDDGRVIANMNVEGMPWYQKKIDLEPARKYPFSQGELISKSQARQYTWYSLLAAFYIVAIFSATWVLFTLFCLYVWFR